MLRRQRECGANITRRGTADLKGNHGGAGYVDVSIQDGRSFRNSAKVHRLDPSFESNYAIQKSEAIKGVPIETDEGR